MKKILLSSIILFLFSASIVLFQISCKKDAKAEVSPTDLGSNLGIILFTKRDNQSNSISELWSANYDGTNQKKINIILPTNVRLYDAQFSPDGKLIFLSCETLSDSAGRSLSYTYTCSPDGSNLKQILTSTSNSTTYFQGAY